jgi:hypothetical protein
MQFLFVHQNITGQFLHVAKFLADRPEHLVMRGRSSQSDQKTIASFTKKSGNLSTDPIVDVVKIHTCIFTLKDPLCGRRHGQKQTTIILWPA